MRSFFGIHRCGHRAHTVSLIVFLIGSSRTGWAEDIYVSSDRYEIRAPIAVVTSLHGVAITEGGLSNGVLTYLVRGDLRLLAGVKGINGTTDHLYVQSGANAVRFVVAGDVIQEGGATIDASASSGYSTGPGGGLGGGFGGSTAGAGGIGGGGGMGGGVVFPLRGDPGTYRGNGAGGAGGGYQFFQQGEARAYGGNGGSGRQGFGNGGNGQSGGERVGGQIGLPGTAGAVGANGQPGLGGSAGGMPSGIVSTPGAGGSGGAGGGGVGAGGSGADIIGDASLQGRFGYAGQAGINGANGFAGADGAGGGGGRINNSVDVDTLVLIAGGGGAQGNGGAGSGGGGGASSGGGGGGGGGGAVNILAGPAGSGGGGGGEGGQGGIGGTGGTGGRGGNGGGGGGALEIVAYGRVWLNDQVRADGQDGAAGLFGVDGAAGFAGGSGNSAGQGGIGEVSGGLGFGAGGNGGVGGTGGAGGNGGAPSRGGGGGGGAGGMIHLSATWLATDSGTVSILGGAGGAGYGVNGIGSRGDNGFFVYGQAVTATPNFGQVNASLTRRVANFFPSQPNLYAGGVSTPRLVAASLSASGLTEGPASFGVWPGNASTDADINAAIVAAPPGATACLVRLRPTGTHSVRTDITNHFVVALVNFPTAATRTGAMLGQGATPLQPLLRLGWAREPRFGGNGQPMPVTSLAPNRAFFCVLPEANGNRVAFSDGVGSWAAALSPGQAIYNVSGAGVLPVAQNLMPWTLGADASANGVANGVPAGRAGVRATYWPDAISTTLNSPVGLNIITEATAIDDAGANFFGVGTLQVFVNTLPIYFNSATTPFVNLPTITTGNETVTASTPLAASRFNGQTAAGRGMLNGRPVALYWTIHPLQLMNLDALVADGVSGAGSEASGVFGGTVVGTRFLSAGLERAVLWTGGLATDLHLPSHFTETRARDVEYDLIVGRGITNGQAHAVAWSVASSATMIDLHPPGWQSSEAIACNGTNIVGIGRDAAGRDHALVWLTPQAGAARDLTPLVGDWGGTPRPTGIDAQGNISLNATGGDGVQAWLLARSGVVFRPTITHFAHRPGAGGSSYVDLRWNSRPGRSYQVEYGTAPGQWQFFGAPMAATQNTTETLNIGPIIYPEQFFRIRELP